MTDTEYEYEIADAVPTDSEGHPIHPERGHRICGALKSDRSTPAPHGRSRDDYSYCLQPAGWGTDTDIGACRNHPYQGSQIGESNPNFEDGRTSEYFKSKLSERQSEVYDEIAEKLADPDEAVNILRHVATRMIMVGEHANDPAMVREGRQLLSEFNIVPSEQQIEGTIDVNQTTNHEIGEETREILDDLTGGL